MTRKYTRKPKLDAPGCDSSPIKEESSINLPPDILQSIERTCKMRKSLGLTDDREERIQRALRYQEFINE